MANYKLLLDESGSFSNKKEKYIIIGGVLFNEEYQTELEKIFVPIHKLMCDVFKREELHGTENKKYFNYLCAVIGSNEYIEPVIFVIDKQKAFIFDKYDKISFKYNKAIEWFVLNLLANSLITFSDNLYIKIDNINLNEKEKENLNNYLPNKFNFVCDITEADSKDVICLQLADIIVNHFSKNRKCKLSSEEIKLLKPSIFYFLPETYNDYIIE